MGMSACLAQMAACRALWAKGAGERAALGSLMGYAHIYGPYEMRAMARAAATKSLLEVDRAVPLAVSAPICDLIEHGAATWPAQFTLLEADVPMPCGFVWFDRPLVLPATTFEGATYDDALHGVSWEVESYDPSRFDEEREPVGTVRGIGYTFYTVNERGQPRPLDTAGWVFGDDEDWVHRMLRPPVLDRDVQARIKAATTYLASFLRFISSRVLVTEAQPVRNKGTLRRMRADLPHTAPTVLTVRLRRAERPAGVAGEREGVEWSHRWLVGGHWRQQFYARSKEHRPKWIAPYVKGDPSKPLLLKDKQYAVAR